MNITAIGLIGFAVIVVASFLLDIKYDVLNSFTGCAKSSVLLILMCAALLAVLIAMGL